MSIIQYGNIYSDVLAKQMAFSIYLPDKYDGESRFPVLYFFHGRSGNERIMDELEIKSIADVLIDFGQIKPMIIVCPRIDNTRGLNTSEASHPIVSHGMEIDSGRYEDYFIQEVLPYIDNHFKTIPHRENRFVGGASTGGFVATHYGLQYPELFSRIGGHMPAIEFDLAPSDIPIMEMNTVFIKTILWSSTDLKSCIKCKSGFLMQGMKMKVVSTMRWNHCPRY